jgi:p-hydroxybenzoate 3-monooxygenase
VKTRRTQVGIVGAGPAGLLLSQMLHIEGIESIVIESRSRQEIEATIRAGLLEQGTVDLLKSIGAGERLVREGSVHKGIHLRFAGRDLRIDFEALAGGKCVTLYAQHEVLKDLVKARLDAGGEILFSTKDASVDGIDTARPKIRFGHEGEAAEIECDYVAGCDGTHGISHGSIPEGVLKRYERTYPFGWFGILCEAPRSSEELIYALHDRGFALVTTRSATLQRMYLQCDPHDRVESWPDERIWAELRARLANSQGWAPKEGPITHKIVIAMRSLVTEPMQHGRLFLAGDAAHVVPPTGAKGLNLAAADVTFLARALVAKYRRNDSSLLEGYSGKCLRRVWKAQRFSWWMTSMLHRFPGDEFQFRLQQAELGYLEMSESARRTLAENYVGLPLEA